ncbi:PIN2/TERF1-interacting telomerase inhibitor 1 [Chaetodon auriga]|uniref:PIN2/TERF1-interacting telomerase inhibitor 1 n=1 Tax=Chaetodon auriga TaxID=39042 RepID=UPI00403307A8
MSMLAEPRRKQKWSVDPRNSAWSNDDSKFGQKMLERMGWSKGKGLGRNEQGSTDHIKVKLKNNSYGLGTNVSYEDNWIAHQDDFNELLAQLNNHHGQNNNNNTEPQPDEKKSFSLEEKSKTSRKRVHYMKFTKGKDLSSRTETDLNCIFGKRANSAKDQEQGSNISDSQGETEAAFTPASSELDTESITKTVTSALNMQQYFAQRMAQLKKARGHTHSTAPSEANETSGPSEEPSPTHSSNDGSEEPKKKKKKKSKKSADEQEVAEENSSAAIVIEDNEDQPQERPGKKKKKRKRVENEGATNENCSSTSGVEQNCEELPPSKKKKKKKKLKNNDQECELLNGHGPTEGQSVASEVAHKKKKKHRAEQVDAVVKEEEQELVEKKSKKDKKKKKKHQE